MKMSPRCKPACQTYFNVIPHLAIYQKVAFISFPFLCFRHSVLSNLMSNSKQPNHTQLAKRPKKNCYVLPQLSRRDKVSYAKRKVTLIEYFKLENYMLYF